MPKVKFRYNPETLSYDKIEKGFMYYFSRLLLYVLFGSIFGLISFFSFSSFFESPRQKKLQRENRRLTTEVEIMSEKLNQLIEVLDDMQRRDENVYRVIFQADSIPMSIRKAGLGGVNRYEPLKELENSELVIATAKKLDVVVKQAYVQSKSFDEIIEKAKNKEEWLAATPAIMPISNKDLKRTASGWGYRIHPIYKTRRFHTGMDFTAPTGTEVYATGNGKISKITREKTGYGNRIEIDHGFGYKTLYAHLNGFNVKNGQKVKRGDVIGFVGSTGTSTAPHLHYEVHVKGKKVNPSHYYFNDLTAEEYEEMIKISSISNQTFD